MWYELTDDQGNTSSYGFAPDEEHHGSPFAPGQRYRTDSSEYKTTAYSREIEISQAQYDAMQKFGEDPTSAGFSMRYNGLTNSCIDFTWKALEVGGLNPSGYEGALWPTHNISAVKNIKAPAPAGGAGGASSSGSGAISHVCNNAVLMCSFGMAPSAMGVLPLNRMMTSNQPAANIMDHIPIVNIRPFGMCTCPANPTVAAATAAALGVLTPMPCVPATTAPWMPGAPTVMLGNMPALDNTSKLMCMWGGLIQVSFPGQVTEHIP